MPLLDDGSSSPFLGTAEVSLRFACFVTELSDIVLGNTFRTEYISIYKAVLNNHLSTSLSPVQHINAYTLRPCPTEKL